MEKISDCQHAIMFRDALVHENEEKAMKYVPHLAFSNVFKAVINDPVDEYNYNLLNLASDKGYLKAVEFLIKSGANLDCQHNLYHRSSCVWYCDLNANGPTALMIAAQNGHEKVVQLLMKAGANVNLFDDEGYSALTYACLGNFIDIASWLVEAGSNEDVKKKALIDLFDVRNHNAKHNYEAIVQLLLDANVCLNDKYPNLDDNIGWILIGTIESGSIIQRILRECPIITTEEERDIFEMENWRISNLSGFPSFLHPTVSLNRKYRLY